MTTFFDIKLIQAEHGDAILVSYGTQDTRHLLVDGGPSTALPNLLGVLEGARREGILTLEAIVVTHYDYDHIGGIIELLENLPEWLTIKDIWFNGNKHLLPKDMLGPKHSELLANLIENRQFPWNRSFDYGAVTTDWTRGIELEGGVTVKILSPTRQDLASLAYKGGTEYCVSEKAEPRDLLGRKDTWPPPSHSSLLAQNASVDQSASNASSIALLLSHGDKHFLLSGDAHSDVIYESLEKISQKGKVKLDLLKMSHHGSHANSSTTLLRKLQCKRFAFSTSGKFHFHPDQITIARVIDSAYKPELIFNYDNIWTGKWRNIPESWPTYSTVFPSNETSYVRVLI